jgi:hypothetical protein
VSAVFVDTDKKVKYKNDGLTSGLAVLNELADFSLQSVATAAGTTTLTNTSPNHITFTGVTTQTCVLPDATTLTAGKQYEIHNNSTGLVTVNTSGGATLWTLGTVTFAQLTLLTNSVAAGTWDVHYLPANAATGTLGTMLTSVNPTTAVGTNAIASMTITPGGVVLTSAAAGAVEVDAAAKYYTVDTTNGRRYDDSWNFFRLTGNGTPFTAITDFFGSTSAIPTVLNGVYEIEWHCYFAIATLSTQVVTWTIVNTQTVTNMVAGWAAMTALANGATAGRAHRRGSRRTDQRIGRAPRNGRHHDRQPLPRREGAHRSGHRGQRAPSRRDRLDGDDRRAARFVLQGPSSAGW